ncbi:MAG: cytochrome C [Pseudomonadota bacterium]|nr:MAG: cytochrome C [Pseudomonadota bacterium]
MKRKLWIILGMFGLIATSTWVFGDDGERHTTWLTRLWREARLDVAPANDVLYRAECGSCHFAYQPGLLPVRSWEEIMKRLDDHFGESAELDVRSSAEITRYLTANAADRVDYKRSKRFAAAAATAEPTLRITATRYFLHKHDEIPQWVLEQGERPLKLFQCDICHTEADKGSYDEHQVHIPGLGRWED